ncbi:MAG TPA: DUF6443 domain-containing protein, partial [Puia sp.]|nr:DUF6443 domain-containing protein [Puia sp.]
MFKDIKYHGVILLLLCFFSTVHGQIIIGPAINGPTHIYSGDKACYSVTCGNTSTTWSSTIGFSLGSSTCGHPPFAYLANQFQFPSTSISVLSGTINSFSCGGNLSLNVQVYPPMGPASITPGGQTVIVGTPAAPFVAATPTGWDGNFTYNWQSSTDGTNWTSVAGTQAFTPPSSVVGTTLYRVVVSATSEHSSIASVSVTVIPPPLVPGVLTPGSLTLPPGTSPGILTATKASGGGCGGSYGYQWQRSTDGGTWSDIAGATNLYYNPGNIGSTVFYRVRIICGTDTVYTAVARYTARTVSTDMNFIRERTVLKPGVMDTVTADGLTNATDVRQTTQYFDGLGRRVQTVAKQASPLLHDLVTMQAYDRFGREAVKYLPYTSPSTDGNFKTNPTGEQNNFNAGQFPNDQYFYGQTDFETSPLNRPLKDYQAGNSWVGNVKGVSS